MDKEIKEYQRKNFELNEINKKLKGKLKKSEEKSNQLENKLGEKNKEIENLREENE